MFAVPWLNPILLHWGVQRTGGTKCRGGKGILFPHYKSNSVTDIKRQAHRRSKQSMEWGSRKSLAAVKQEKIILPGKNSRKRKLMQWGKILSSVRACFPPSCAVYCYLIVLYSFCKDGLQLLQNAKAHFSSSKNITGLVLSTLHWLPKHSQCKSTVSPSSESTQIWAEIV